VPFVTPDDVHALQQAVDAEALGLASALKACIYAGAVHPGDPLVAQWQSQMDRVQAFLRENPSWLNTASQMNRGEQLQRDLGPWHARMSAAGCANVPPAPTPPPAPQDLFGNIEGIAIAIAVIMVLREMR